MLYEYLKNTYGENEPIFLSELKIDGMSDVNVRQQLKKLTDNGKIKRYDTGIYFIPGKSIFRSGAKLSFDDVIRKKYLENGSQRCGYVSGISFANQIGITTQVPMCCEVVSNKATKDYRELTLGKSKVALRKPKVTVDKDNYKELQFLDLIRNIDVLSDLPKEELIDRVFQYMSRSQLLFERLEKYLPYYPDKIYRNLYEMGLLSGVSAQG